MVLPEFASRRKRRITSGASSEESPDVGSSRKSTSGSVRELHGQVDTLALAAADSFLFSGSDENVLGRLKVKLLQHVADAFMNFGFSVIAGQPQSRGKIRAPLPR